MVHCPNAREILRANLRLRFCVRGLIPRPRENGGQENERGRASNDRTHSTISQSESSFLSPVYAHGLAREIQTQRFEQLYLTRMPERMIGATPRPNSGSMGRHLTCAESSWPLANTIRSMWTMNLPSLA